MNVVRKLLACTRGNVLALTAFTMPLLVGAAGMGVDTAQWYYWRREMQFAADQAALAGAYALSQDKDWQTRVSAQFENNREVASFATIASSQLSNFGTGTDNAVSVVLHGTKSLPFSGIFLKRGVTVSVAAQAAFRNGADWSSCMVATNASESGAITVIGNANLNLGCGMAALSTSSSAIVISGTADISATSIISAGGIDTGGSADFGEAIVAENVGGLNDPFAGLTPPDNPTPRTYKCSGTGANATASLQPGTYTSLETKCNTTFASGVYVLDGGSFTIRSQDIVTGSGVMFVLKNGATVHWNGGAAVTLTAPTAAQLPAMGITDPRLAGMLIFEHPSTNGDAENHSVINGNASTVINGAIYMPNTTLSFSGTSRPTSQCLMMVADKLDIGGTTSMSNFCPTGQHLQGSVGSTTGYVRLVA
ncbi:pilus assembly protein TadG-related protein [Aquisediminimonas sediminicola]|uniref:pilus assembly protein TadG-related protein n=1 Tax=Alteraquisediminimonas sediminicola TaxID=2676787 RepID=UPI001C8DE0BC|nr:pilus assembly protein TadG-related protein [Aquisediminimonas sediminicola]